MKKNKGFIIRNICSILIIIVNILCILISLFNHMIHHNYDIVRDVCLMTIYIIIALWNISHSEEVYRLTCHIHDLNEQINSMKESKNIK